jgi:hypothetical protein
VKFPCGVIFVVTIERRKRIIPKQVFFLNNPSYVPGKFAASIVDTVGKFASGINNTSGAGGKICRRCR